MGLIKKIFIGAGISFLVLLLLGGAVLFYLYNYHTFYTARVCVGGENENSRISCSTDNECDRGFFENREVEDFLETAPESIKNKFVEIIDAAVYCENTCKMKKIYGEGLGDVKKVEQCNLGDREFIVEIKGRDGLALLKFFRSKE